MLGAFSVCGDSPMEATTLARPAKKKDLTVPGTSMLPSRSHFTSCQVPSLPEYTQAAGTARRYPVSRTASTLKLYRPIQLRPPPSSRRNRPRSARPASMSGRTLIATCRRIRGSHTTMSGLKRRHHVVPRFLRRRRRPPRPSAIRHEPSVLGTKSRENKVWRLWMMLGIGDEGTKTGSP